MVPPMTSVAVSPSRLARTWSPWVSTTEAKVTCGRPRRSASIAGTTLMPASVEAMPHMIRSAGPTFSIALASTSEVAMASEPAMASSMTWMPLSAPICSALRTASTAFSGPMHSAVTSVSSPAFSLIWRACSTAYSSSSDRSPSTPTRSTVLSDSNCRSAVASGTYFTQTTMFIRVMAGYGPSCALGCGREATAESTSAVHTVTVGNLTVPDTGGVRVARRGRRAGRRRGRRARPAPSWPGHWSSPGCPRRGR
ncbi:unannotated protein [freshwater metagenome]|uniref:Unannotated protein n=1 Tax=freshwater metagenome TaxID=449393 RepID=A0A6J6RUQ0_9ZZZZ